MGNSAGPKITKDGLVLDFDAANSKSYNFYADPYASNVSLHLKMDGANGSTTFTDSSPNALAVTAAGNAQISTTQSKYNGSAGYFDGTNSSLDVAAGITLGTSDFTLEGWIYLTALPQNTIYNAGTIIDFRTTDTNDSLFFAITPSGAIYIYVINGNKIQSADGAISINTWYHVAVVRRNSSTSMYLNGTQVSSSWADTTNYPTIAGRSLRIGKSVFSGYPAYLSGYIDNLRISLFARYTASFTSPPIPSTCTDLTKNKNVGTLTNGVDYNFSNGGSLVFNGTSSYITLGTNSNLNFGTGDFTIDCWYKLSATTPNDQGILNDTAGTFSSGSVLFKARQNSSGGKVSLQAYDFSSVGGRILTSSTTIAANIWYNAIVTRIGNSFTLYINGRSESTGTFAGNMNFNNNSGTYIGYSILDAANGYLKGNIPMIKIYKGKGLTSGEVYNNFVANRGRFGV